MAQDQRVLARVARHHGDERKALQHYRSALRQTPDDSGLLGEVGAFALAHGDVDLAESAYGHLWDVGGDAGEGLLPLAHYHWVHDSRSRAVALYEAAEGAGLDDSAVAARVTLWRLLQGEWEAARARLDQPPALVMPPGEQALQLLLAARLAMRQQAYGDALQALEAAVAQCEWARLLLADDLTWEPLRRHHSCAERFEALLFGLPNGAQRSAAGRS